MLNGTSPLLRTQFDLVHLVDVIRQSLAMHASANQPSQRHGQTPNRQPSVPLSGAHSRSGTSAEAPVLSGTTNFPARLLLGSMASYAPKQPLPLHEDNHPPSMQLLSAQQHDPAPPMQPALIGPSYAMRAPLPSMMGSTSGSLQAAYGKDSWRWHGQDMNAQGGAPALALHIVRKLMELSNGSRTDWRHNSQLVTCREFLLLCDVVVETLRAEDSLVHVPLPCRVYGDIHGQLLDLLEFFNAFSWPDKRRGDIFSMTYVFLGDFVDRGAYSCDVITLLFSLKVLYPTKVFLVRGNHEDRLMNINYGFHEDCIRKFGQDGGTIWERVNDVFEFLPIAALVEGTILCIHGGIGDMITSLDDLRGLPKPIEVVSEITPSTTKQDRVVLDALWSDPTDNDLVLGVHMSPRGKNTCRFGPDRVQEFNRRNGLKLIIRAHECVQHGYEYFAAGQLLTVFSATNYCNQYNNDGAMVVLVKDARTGEVVEHAQVIKSGTVDTSHGWNDQQFRAPSPMRRAPEPCVN